MANSVIAIGLDAAEPKLIEKWMEQGYLPHLAKLKQEGAYGRLKSVERYRAETAWPTFLTGCTSRKAGYWGPVKLRDGTYTVDGVGAYQFDQYSPFYALGADAPQKVAIFDMPQTRLSAQVNGVQVIGWGSHSTQVESGSSPAPLLEELTEKHGIHPAFGHDHTNIYGRKKVKHLYENLREGIRRRSKICQDLIQREDWSLFLTMFGEAHSAGHYMLHMHESDHPAHYSQAGEEDLLRAAFEEMDKAIGEMMEAAPADASVVVFSAHGMQANNLDLPSTFFLAEMLYRWNFPGEVAFASTPVEAPLKQVPLWRCQRRPYQDLWAQQKDSNPLTRFLRTITPTKVHRIYAQLLARLGLDQGGKFVSPYTLQNQNAGFPCQVASWLAPSWPKMKAFALPSFSEGYVRINLQGREPNGLVAPSEYEAVCDEVIAQIEAMRDAGTGKPLMKEVIRTRTAETIYDEGLPDADIIVMWNDTDLPSNCVESPTIGRIGPVPFQRSGGHNSSGFVMIKDSRVEPGSQLPERQSMDLPPTLLALMGVESPDYFDGTSMIVEEKGLVSVG